MTEYTNNAWRPHYRGGWITKVVGVTHEPGYPGFTDILIQAEAKAFLRPGMIMPSSDPDTSGWLIQQHIDHPEYETIAGVLIRNPRNAHDANTVEVHVPLLESRVGFLPAQLAAIVAPLLDTEEVRFRVDVWAVPNLVKPEFPGVRCLLTPATMT